MRTQCKALRRYNLVCYTRVNLTYTYLNVPMYSCVVFSSLPAPIDSYGKNKKHNYVVR